MKAGDEKHGVRGSIPLLTMLYVVPMHKFAGPASGLIQIFESTPDILMSVLGGSEGRFRKGVVVARPWSGVRGFDSEPVEHRQNGGRFERRAVIAVQDGLGLLPMLAVVSFRFLLM